MPNRRLTPPEIASLQCPQKSHSYLLDMDDSCNGFPPNPAISTMPVTGPSLGVETAGPIYTLPRRRPCRWLRSHSAARPPDTQAGAAAS